jgi:catechol 2,3-dioxygenase-like lactoylglutathione lyase family enzyme
MTAVLHHVITFTNDMDRSLLLYRDILGLDLKWRLPEVGGRKMSAVFGVPEMKAEMAYLAPVNGGVAVELVKMIQPDANARSDGTGLSLRVEQLDVVYGKLREHDWQPFTEPVDMLSPEGEAIRMFCFRSDEGLLIELLEAV